MKRIYKVMNLFIIIGASCLMLATLSLADQLGPNNPVGAARFLYGEAPPWAPPQGQQARYRYQYFPSAQVYYDPVRELFFFQKNGQWVKSPGLPGYLRNRLGDFVVLEMNTDTPYIFQAQVSKHYPSKPTVVTEREVGSSNRIYIEESSAPTTQSAIPEPTGPPPWKPTAYGPVYHYKYYPTAFIYFDMDRKVWFYQLDNGSWVQSAVLPENLADNLGRPVMLEMNTDRPYVYQAQVMERYPHPGLEINKSVYTIGPVVK